MPESGYVSCACRDCFDLAISSDDQVPTLCQLCADADCARWHVDQGPYSCQREDAYSDEPLPVPPNAGSAS